MNQEKRPFWHKFHGYEEDTSQMDMRAIARHVLDPIFQANITDRGTVHITVPESYREGLFSVPRAFETTLGGQNERFSRRCYGPGGGEKQALTFWLKPEAMSGDMDAKLAAFARALAKEHQIDPLEIQYFVPKQDIREKFHTVVGCGVAIATSAKHKDDLKRVIATIQRERIPAELPVVVPKTTLSLPKPKPPFSWAERMHANDKHSPRHQISFHDIIRDKAPLAINPVEIADDGIIIIDLSMVVARELNETNDGPLKLICKDVGLKECPQYHRTHGLGIWMKPEFLGSGDASDEQRFDNAHIPIRALCQSIHEQFGMPIYASLLNLEEALDNPHHTSSSMIVLMTDSAHQDKLFGEVRNALIKAGKSLPDGPAR